MNKKFRDIANEFQVEEEIAKTILERMNVEDFNKNPSKERLEVFRTICENLKNGTELEKAIAVGLQENGIARVKSENKTELKTTTGIGEESQEIGRKTGRQIARIIPPLQRQGCTEVVDGFNRGLAEGFKEALEEVNIIEVFDEFSDLDIEDMRQGKFQSGSNNAALAPGNSESSPEA